MKVTEVWKIVRTEWDWTTTPPRYSRTPIAMIYSREDAIEWLKWYLDNEPDDMDLIEYDVRTVVCDNDVIGVKYECRYGGDTLKKSFSMIAKAVDIVEC